MCEAIFAHMGVAIKLLMSVVTSVAIRAIVVTSVAMSFA